MNVRGFRQKVSFALMILGAVMLFRGVENAVTRGLGWQGIMMSLVVGALVFFLGLTRWRYLRHR